MRSISPMLRHDSSGVFGNNVGSMEEGDVDGVAASVPGFMKSKSFNSKTLNRTITSNIVRLKPCRNSWSGLFLFFSLSVSSNMHICRDLQLGKVAVNMGKLHISKRQSILVLCGVFCADFERICAFQASRMWRANLKLIYIYMYYIYVLYHT
jgi:hypothetical protein